MSQTLTQKTKKERKVEHHWLSCPKTVLCLSPLFRFDRPCAQTLPLVYISHIFF